MFELERLYSGSSTTTSCEGCSILKNSSKPFHAHMDHEDLPASDVLFLSDSYKWNGYEKTAFKKEEIALFQGGLSGYSGFTWTTSPSVKCPAVKEADMSPSNMKICREYLTDTIRHVNPRLIFVCGNLAMKMLIKKSGISSKRGRCFMYEGIPVVPLFHPQTVINEPRHKFLFDTDIKNSIDKYILNKEVSHSFEYKVIMSYEDLNEFCSELIDTSETIACDIETTGLDFLRDKMMTIAFSLKDKGWVLPIDHKEVEWEDSMKESILRAVSEILSNKRNKKVFHNAKFDLKFLKQYGIKVENVWDTKLMHHLIDENTPKSLMELVKIYFPKELESF